MFCTLTVHALTIVQFIVPCDIFTGLVHDDWEL